MSRASPDEAGMATANAWMEDQFWLLFASHISFQNERREPGLTDQTGGDCGYRLLDQHAQGEPSGSRMGWAGIQLQIMLGQAEEGGRDGRRMEEGGSARVCSLECRRHGS